MELPGSTESNVMMVGTAEAYKGFVVDKEALLSQNKRYQKEKVALQQLDTCVEEKNLEPVLVLLLDEAVITSYSIHYTKLYETCPGNTGHLSPEA